MKTATANNWEKNQSFDFAVFVEFNIDHYHDYYKQGNHPMQVRGLSNACSFDDETLESCNEYIIFVGA